MDLENCELCHKYCFSINLSKLTNFACAVILSGNYAIQPLKLKLRVHVYNNMSGFFDDCVAKNIRYHIMLFGNVDMKWNYSVGDSISRTWSENRWEVLIFHISRHFGWWRETIRPCQVKQCMLYSETVTRTILTIMNYSRMATRL